jgi:glycine/D-amino acid oxidase-like deaminating enzyme
MQPSPMAETSSLLLPSVRVFIASLLYPEPERAISVMLPSDAPVFVGARRPHDQLSAGQLEQAGQILADEAPDQGTLDVKRELARAFVDLVSAERGLVPALRESPIEQTWAGLRPGSFDGFPYLGPLPGLKNSFIAAGHFRSGLFLSTATAIVMSQLLRGEEPQIDLAPFRVGR